MFGQNIIYLKRFVLYNKTLKQSKPTSETKIIVNSVGKSGTHLVMKALELFPEMYRFPLHLGRQRLGLLPWCWLWSHKIYKALWWQYRAHTVHFTNQMQEEMAVPIDSDSPFFLPISQMEAILDSVEPGWFIMGHLPYSEELDQLIKQKKFKMILVFRDPRDVVISHARYLSSKATHYMYPYYHNLPEDKQLSTSILGVSNQEYIHPLESIEKRLKSAIPWMRTAYTHTTYFEKLIGEEGGGTSQLQLQALAAIADHVGFILTESKLQFIASQLYGGTRTFRSGILGKWKKLFSQYHKDIFKEHAGDLLIELGYEQDFNW